MSASLQLDHRLLDRTVAGGAPIDLDAPATGPEAGPAPDSVAYYLGAAEILDVMPERVIRFRVADLVISYCNAAWASGHQRVPAEVIGRTLDEFLSPEEKAGATFQLARLGPDSPLLADDVARPAPNAPGQWVEWVDRYLTGANGPEVIAVGRDVTGRHIAELNLAASEARFRDLADHSADVVWRFLLEPTPHFDYMSPSVENILGYPASVFIDDFRTFVDILDEEGRAIIAAALRGELMPERSDFRLRRKDGTIVIGEMSTTLIRGGLQGVSRDVTELRALQEKLTALALRDPLTGLANRRLFNELLDADLARTQRSGHALAVAYLDLDDFKKVNDTYGHDAGDTVLCETARRLLSMVRSADGVGRIGGDEFVIVYEPSDTSARTPGDPATDALIRRVDALLSAPIELDDKTSVCCPASIGRADTTSVGYDAVALLAAADADMYRVKKARRQGRLHADTPAP